MKCTGCNGPEGIPQDTEWGLISLCTSCREPRYVRPGPWYWGHCDISADALFGAAIYKPRHVRRKWHVLTHYPNPRYL